MWNILNSIPVLGHVKGVIHYATGDSEAGARAMLDSTRSTAVIGAGAVGFAAGPVGSAVFGAYVGAAWDVGESIAADKPMGLVGNINKVVQTAKEGEVPVSAILQTALTLGGDVLGGVGGGSVVNSVAQATASTAAGTVGKSVGKSTGETILKSASYSAGETFGKTVAQSVGSSVSKSVGKTVAKEIAVDVATIVTTQAVAKKYVEVLEEVPQPRYSKKQSKSSGNSSGKTGGSTGCSTGSSTGGTTSRTGTGKATGTTSGTTDGSNSGSGQPPKQNPKSTPNNAQQQQTTIQAFLDLFGVQSLDDIQIRGQHIFRKLEKHQKDYLKKLIKSLLKKGILSRVIQTILNILNTVSLGDVTYLNFISLSEFIQQYIGEQTARQNELVRQRSLAPGSVRHRTPVLIDIVSTQIVQHDCTILRIFQEIRAQIYMFPLLISFRDIFATAYHYYKHRLVDRYELTVANYKSLINENLQIIMTTQEYHDLLISGGEIEFERFYVLYGTRLFIKIKMQGDTEVLSTAYFMDDSTEGDQDGDMYIDGRKL